MTFKHVLVVAQAIPQWYVDVLTNALGPECRVDIITGTPGLRGHIIPSPPHDARSFKSRLLCWWRHWRFMNRWMKENKHQSYDLIFAISNPPINSSIGLKLKKRFKAPFVYMNWDLYPQVIECSIKNPLVQFVCRLWHRWNERHYPQMDTILTIGKVMAQSMKAPAATEIPVQVLPISVDTERLKPICKEENPFCQEHHLTDKFVVLYSGKMGMGHNIEVILQASLLLKEHADIVFAFIGSGPKYALVADFIAQEKPENVRLFPLQPEEMFPYSMACGDVGIVTQEASMAHLFMPSKTYSMMACGQAIVGICTPHDDLYGLLAGGSFGRSITSDSATDLAECLLELYRNPAETQRMQANARAAACERFDNAIAVQAYQTLFASLERRVE